MLVFLSISNLQNFQRSFAARRDEQRCSGNVSAVCARVCDMPLPAVQLP
jgi:hypothetical protein